MRAHGGRAAHLRALCALILAAGLAAALTASAFASDGASLRTVRVGYYPMSNFQEYDAGTGEYRGYSYDYMLAVAQYADWEYEFVPVSYDEGLQMLEDGRLDLMNGVGITDALSQHLSFSALPSGESCTCLAVAADNIDVAYEDFAAIGGLTVGLDYASTRDSGFVDYCKDNDCMPQLVYYHTADGVAQGMAAGEINACLVSSLEDVDMRTVAKFDTQSYYFATAKGSSDLLKELNAAMNALKTSDSYFEEKIYAKYHAKSPEEQTVISDSEQAFISENPVIRVAYDPAWYPISYRTEDGGFGGAMAAIFQRISERTGLTFEYVCGDTEEESLALFTSGQAQVMAGFPYDYTWAAQCGAWITAPFTTLTVFTAYPAGRSPSDVAAVPAGSYLPYLSGHIRQDGYSFVSCPSVEDCLDAVVQGRADYVFLDSYQMEYYRERSQYRGLSFKVANGEDYGLSLAVSRVSDQRLYTILSKTLNSIGSDEISSVFRETSIEARSRSLLDMLYANPRAAGFFFALLGFLAAVLISAGIYTRRMRAKNAELRAATAAKSEFLSNISHDMRTPLNGIIGYTDLALKSPEPEKRTDYLNKIRISGRFLLSLINDTLDISKIESGKFVLYPEPVECGELLQSIVVPVRQSAEAKGVRVVVDTSAMKGGYILADRLSLQKVILNLLSNAVKFTPEGGTVWLTVADLDPPENGCNARITVRDTGIGIGETFLPKLFEPFTQERAPESGEAMGTGLGLSIVKRIVTLMGGRVSASSEKGAGSRFDVLLPIRRLEDYVPAQTDGVRRGDALSGCRALLCEDNAMNREIAVALLRELGMETVCAENGRKGVELFADAPAGAFDVVLMDLRMPEMDGYAAAAAIRALDRPDAGVPIIAMSADAYEDDIRRCREAGMNGHVAKPVDPNALRTELEKFCGKRGGDA